MPSKDAPSRASDFVARGTGEAIDDVRFQLVERGWFGQQTPSHDVRHAIDTFASKHQTVHAESDAGEHAVDPADLYGYEPERTPGAGHAPEQTVDPHDLYGYGREPAAGAHEPQREQQEQQDRG